MAWNRPFLVIGGHGSFFSMGSNENEHALASSFRGSDLAPVLLPVFANDDGLGFIRRSQNRFFKSVSGLAPSYRRGFYRYLFLLGHHLGFLSSPGVSCFLHCYPSLSRNGCFHGR